MIRLSHRFKHISEIPKIYLGDYLTEWTRLMKNRVRLSVAMFLVVFIGANGIRNLLMFGRIGQETLLAWGILICGCAAILVLAGKASNIRVARISAILLIILVLTVLTVYYTAAHTFPHMPVITFICVLFGTTFAIPWRMLDVSGLAALYAGAYTVYFLNVKTYVYKGQTFAIEFSDLLQGLILIAAASAVCILVTRYENERRVKNFIILKDIENKSRQMQEELELATRVHSRLIPHSAKTRLADIAVTYVPMYYMGGDYAKFFIIDKNKLIFIICDVTGHGVSAALLVNALNSEFERLAKEGKRPGDLLKELDRFITNDFEGSSMYLTAFCGLLDYGHLSRKFTYSNYGHPPQYIYRTTKSAIEKISAQTSFLGLPIEDDNVYETEMPFNKNDQILLFTDGIIEAVDADNDQYGHERLEAFIRKNNGLDAEAFNQRLLNELNSFTGNNLKDDVFILNIKTK
ncbi:PP2C family protein-serine/threonine phosphatase [Candidatus Omnitrophota bacterium]